MLASSNSGATDNSRPEVSCRYRFVWRPCSACSCALMVPWHRLKRKFTVYCDEERGIWGHPSPSWVGRHTWCKTQLVMPLTAACAFTESASKVSATVHSAGNRNTASVCLSPELSTLLPSALTNTKKAPVWEWHPVLSASDPLALAFATETLHTVCADLPYTLIWCSLTPTLHLGWFGDVKLLGEKWREWAFFFLLKINSSACGGGAYL